MGALVFIVLCANQFLPKAIDNITLEETFEDGILDADKGDLCRNRVLKLNNIKNK